VADTLQDLARMALCHTAVFENLRGNRRLSDRSRVLPSNCSATDPNLILPVGSEVAPFSAAQHSGIGGASAIVTSRAFGCGCAMLHVEPMNLQER